MRISRKSEYALRALVFLARHAGACQIQELSRREQIPVKFLEQILLTLRHAGFLASRRGVGGGYSLRMDPAQISVGEVIAAMDGPVAPVPCAAAVPAEKCTCPDPGRCAVRIFMTEVRVQLEETLAARSIEDLARLGTGGGILSFEI
jgi:Rrf2 family protein